MIKQVKLLDLQLSDFEVNSSKDCFPILSTEELGLSSARLSLEVSLFIKHLHYKNPIMCFLRLAEELSVVLNSPVETSPFLLSPHIPDRDILLGEAFFVVQRRFFFLLDVSLGSTNVAEIGQVVVVLTLEVKLELVLSCYQSHGMGSNNDQTI